MWFWVSPVNKIVNFCRW